MPVKNSNNSFTTMSEPLQNSNPWAEKLQQVSLPEPGESKRLLLDLLDRELPLPPKKDNRRWLLVLLLLLLLIGVCNCPGIVRHDKPTVGNRPAATGRTTIANSLPTSGTAAKPGTEIKTAEET